MNQAMLMIVLALMSVIVALEGAWLSIKIQSDKYIAWLNNKFVILIIKLVYFLGFPFLALISGLIPARYFGLKGLQYLIIPNFHAPASEVIQLFRTQLGYLFISWLPDFGPIVSTGALLSLTFILFLWHYLAVLKKEDALKHLSHIYASKLNLLLDAVHWAFYRAIVWSLSGSLYLGVVGGLLFILLEYIGMSKLGRFSPLQQQVYLLKFAIGLTMALIFFFVPNLWFIIIIQFILVAAVETLMKLYQNTNTQRAYVIN